jgi:ADP-dependent phosphofructokinase/glucokinase
MAGGPATDLWKAVWSCMANERDGEVVFEWAGGDEWLREVLGPPGRAQVGGTGPQAAWALATLGAACVLALEIRSAEQLAVLHPDVLLCSGRRLVPAGRVGTEGGSAPARHHVIEFPAGTKWEGRRLRRACRLIVRFAPRGLEYDEEFLSAQERLAREAPAAQLSGVNALSPSDQRSMRLADELSQIWEGCGVPARHLELGDTREPASMRAMVARLWGRFTSLGLSWSELQTIWRSSDDEAESALALAKATGTDCAFVHADRWSLAVHRLERGRVIEQLMAGNLLAAVRAERGVPGAELVPPARASYSEGTPASAELGRGWRMDAVPSPYLAAPASTIGLGDTFAGGVLLAAALQSGSRTVRADR